MDIGQRIKKRRKELRMSADKLAELLGKNRSTIYRYEAGEIENLPLDVLEPIAKALKTTPAYLMGWADEIEKDPVRVANLHFELLMDEDVSEVLDGFRKLDAGKKKIVKDLIHSLAETEV